MRGPIALLLVPLVATSAAGCRRHVVEPQTPRGKEPTPIAVRYPAAPGSFVKVVGKMRPSVVQLSAGAAVKGGPADWFPAGGIGEGALADDLSEEMHRSLGTGFLIDAEGTIVTNAHVVGKEREREIGVRLEGGVTAKAKVLGQDEESDVAVLKMEVPANQRLAPARLGDSDQLQVGEWVVAIGNPFGHGLTASAGVVSATERRDLPAGRAGLFGFIQTDASIHPGNSGGPLVNTAGEVVGVSTALSTDAPGVGFAVPLQVVHRMLPMLKREGRVVRAWVGLRADRVTSEVAARARLARPTGALITSVVASGPAERAGLRVGDIILRFDSREVIGSNELAWLVVTAGVNRAVPVNAWRAGKPITLSLRTERMPE